MTGPVAVSVQDVERTSRDVTRAQWIVAVVVMAGSAVAAYFTFEHLHEPGVIGVATALAVDCALVMWLRISRRLRAEGITSHAGTALELCAGAMTLYLNVGSGVFKGISEQGARIPLGIAHTFLPVLMVVLGFAGADAHYKLRALGQHKAAEEHAANERDAQRQRLEWEADQARIAAAKKDDADRAERARKDALRAKELDAERHQREMNDRAAERDKELRKAALPLVVLLSLAPLLRNTRPRRRQVSPANRQATSPARRQPASPGRQGTPAQVTTDLAVLADLAKPLLEREPGIGRSRLATALNITPYHARRVLEHIEEQRVAQFEAELDEFIKSGGNPDNATGPKEDTP